MDETPRPEDKHDDQPGTATTGPPSGPTNPQSRHVSPGDTLPGIFLGDEPDDGGPTDRATGTAGGSGEGEGDSGGPSPDDPARRRADMSAAAGFVPTILLLPLTALALVPFWAVINLVTDLGFVTLFLGYLLVGTALFFPSTQRLLLATFFNARTPTPRELETLEPAWHNVLDAAGIPHDRYVLAVSDSPHVEAVAAGGHIVAVSRLALTIFPPGELEAALAHELGHHLGLHSTGRQIALWLEAPILLFARMGQWLELAAYVLALLFAWQAASSSSEVTITSMESFEEWGPAVAAVIAGLGVRVASHLVPTALGVSGLLHAVRNMLGRFSIYYADQIAVDLGYGDELVELLERTVEYRLEGDADSSVDQFLGGQSLIANRIDRIEARLEGGAKPSPL